MAGISLAQLQRIVLTLSSEQTPVATARATVREAARLVGGARATLAFFDAAGQTETVTRYVVGAQADDSPDLREDESYLQRAFGESRVVIHDSDELLPLPAVAVPCQPGRRTVGALGVVFGTPERRPDQSEVEALSHLALIAAIAV